MSSHASNNSPENNGVIISADPGLNQNHSVSLTGDQDDRDNDKTNHNTNNNTNLREIVLKSTKIQLWNVIFMTMLHSLTLTMRQNSYVLYAQSEMSGNMTESEIDSILAGGFIIEKVYVAMICVVYGILSNNYGYDNLLLIQLFITCIGVFLQCFTNNIYIFFIGVSISGTGVLYTGAAYIAWIAPHSIVTKFMTFYFLFWVLGFLLSLIISGILSYLFSIRATFWTTFGINVLMFFYILLFMFKKQNKLEKSQLALITKDRQNMAKKDLEEETEFPIILEAQKKNQKNEKKIKKQTETDAEIETPDDEKNMQESARDTDVKHEATDQLKWYQFPRLSCIEWWLLLLILCINGTVMTVITNVVIFYSAYLIVNLDQNVLIANMHVLLIATTFTFFNFSTQILMSKPKGKKINKFSFLIFLFLILSLELIFLYPIFQKPILLFWIYDIITGCISGAIFITTEIVILEVQPTVVAGKVSGIKAFIGTIIAGIDLFLVAILWNITKQSVFYVSAGLMIICAILSFVCKILNNINIKHKQDITDPRQLHQKDDDIVTQIDLTKKKSGSGSVVNTG